MQCLENEISLSFCPSFQPLIRSLPCNQERHPFAAPTHHHHPKKLCQSMTDQISPGSQTYSSSLGTYKNVSAVLRSARPSATVPNIAVPPSVRHALRRLRTRPQINREVVNSNERVALQTLRTADETDECTPSSRIGMSCMIVATIANGPTDAQS